MTAHAISKTCRMVGCFLQDLSKRRLNSKICSIQMFKVSYHKNVIRLVFCTNEAPFMATDRTWKTIKDYTISEIQSCQGTDACHYCMQALGRPDSTFV